jgi:hypothetical protein
LASEDVFASEDAFDLVALAPLLFSLTWSLPLVVDFRHGGYTISAPIVLQKNSGQVQSLTRGLRHCVCAAASPKRLKPAIREAFTHFPHPPPPKCLRSQAGLRRGRAPHRIAGSQVHPLFGDRF